MTHDEMIAVIQAHRDGKAIEYTYGKHGWMSATTPSWDFSAYTYRVKPEPREWWVVLAKDKTVFLTGYPTESLARSNWPDYDVVKVREVLK